MGLNNRLKKNPLIIYLLAFSHYSLASSSFNCVEVGEDEINGKLFTKTTEQSFQFDIIATQNDITVDTLFANSVDHTVTVELVDTNSGDGSCANYTTLISHPLLFTASDSGTKPSLSFSLPNASRAVKCRVTDTTNTPTIVGCSTDSFAIRPTTLSMTSNLTNIGTKAKTGENFVLTATAINGYTGTPKINQSNIEPHADAPFPQGIISGSFNPANAVTGISTSTTFSYSEVGLLRFVAQGIFDNDFTAIDQPDDCISHSFSNTVSSKKIGCNFGNMVTSDYFGRFTPDHFEVMFNIPTFSPSCGLFTYFGQPIKYGVIPIATISAKNADNITTKNYTGNYWKVDASVASFSPSYTVFNHTLTILEDSNPMDSDGGDGTGTLTFANTVDNILVITKGALTAPSDIDIALSFSLIDTDGIVVTKVNNLVQSNPISFGSAAAGNGIDFDSNNKSYRWGRLSLSNTHGSELTPLSAPLYTEYYDGNHFVQNIDDSCTTFSFANDFSISDASDFNCSFTTQSSPIAIGSGSVKATLANTTVVQGKTNLFISDNNNLLQGSGAGNTGYIDITTQLSNLPWLRYDWDGTGTHNKCPSARATFGIYKGSSKQIYFREVY